jgi:hypothetical protein
MKFYQKNFPCTLLDRKSNEETSEELEVAPVDEKRRSYKSDWLLRYATGMDSSRMAMVEGMLNC